MPRSLFSPRRMGVAVLMAALLVQPVVAARVQAQSRGRGRGAAAAQPTADTAETDRARSLFAEGVELVAGSRFAEAEARFRQALAIRDAPAIRYNLASVLYEQGHYPPARVENERALAAADVPPAVRTAAEELRRHIDERAGFARIELRGPASGGSIAIDGFVITEPGLEIPLSPAPHEITVSIRGEVVAHRQVELAVGEHRVLLLGESADAADSGGSAAGRPIEEEEWFWPVVAGGGAALVLIVGISVGVAVSSGTEGPVEGNFMPGVIRWP